MPNIPERVQATEIRMQAPTSSNIESFLDILVLAGDDPASKWVDIPSFASRGEAAEWVEVSGWRFWLLSKKATPIGYIGIHEANSEVIHSEKFPGYLVSDSFLLSQYRGRRLITEAWDHLLQQLPIGTRFLAEIWEENEYSIRRVERDGWKKVDKVYYGKTEVLNSTGWCIRYTLENYSLHNK